MKKVYIIFIVLIALILSGKVLAYIERSDNIVNDNEDAIYMIGSVYNRLTGEKIKPKEDSFRIYKIDLRDNIKTLFYEVDKRTMDRLTISPDNNYIAVTRREKEKYNHTEILIINKQLRVSEHSINVPDGIITYVWSPDSKKVAYLAGTIGEFGKINSKGIWVYDLERKEKEKIAESALDIEWLPSGELYIYNKSVERKGENVNVFYKAITYSDTGVIKGEKKGINLSLDGRYSTDPRYIGYMPMTKEDEEATHIDFFDLKDGKKILSATLDKIFTERPRILWGPILWLKANRIVVEREIKNSLDWDISICDFENNKVLKEVKGRIVGINTDRSKIVIYFDGKFTAVDVP